PPPLPTAKYAVIEPPPAIVAQPAVQLATGSDSAPPIAAPLPPVAAVSRSETDFAAPTTTATAKAIRPTWGWLAGVFRSAAPSSEATDESAPVVRGVEHDPAKRFTVY